MATKIRLQRHGRKSYAFYSIVIADVRAPRDGKFIEKIGTYNPNTNPATVDLKFDRALEIYCGRIGDLIFMDIQMPVMNGYEATAAIRSLPGEQGKLPIVAMTANAFAEDVQLAKNTGMNGHIAKPLDMNKLNDVLENWL